MKWRFNFYDSRVPLTVFYYRIHYGRRKKKKDHGRFGICVKKGGVVGPPDGAVWPVSFSLSPQLTLEKKDDAARLS
jgi:hypothetical protein